MSNQLRMIVWNVKLGNAVSLHLPNGKLIIFDAGSSSDCSPVQVLHDKFDVKIIDALVITHPHTDHFSDLPNITRLQMGPKVLIRPRDISSQAIREGNKDQALVEKYIDIDARYNAGVNAVDDIYSSACTGSVVIKQFKTSVYAESNLNNRSLVHIVSYGSDKILLPGDCTKEAMKYLIENNSEFKTEIAGITIMVAPHHGHEGDYCSELMKEIKGSLMLCLISDGKDKDDVSAVGLYGGAAKGLNFAKAGGQSNLRKCLTTRTDGWIDVYVKLDGGLSIKTQKGDASC